MIEYHEIDKIVSTTLDTVNKLLTYPNGPDALALYFRYVQQQRMQQNSSTFSLNEFMMGAMKWGKQRLQKAKKVLVDNGMIEITNRHEEETGKFMGQYVTVKFIIAVGALSRQTGEPSDGQTEANTLVTNINTLVTNINTIVPQINQKEKFVEEANAYSNICPKDLIDSFCNHWTETDQKGKMRWQKEKTFQIANRLSTRQRNDIKRKREALERQKALQVSRQHINKQQSFNNNSKRNANSFTRQLLQGTEGEKQSQSGDSREDDF